MNSTQLHISYLYDDDKCVRCYVVCIKREPSVEEKWLAIACNASKDEVEKVCSPITKIQSPHHGLDALDPSGHGEGTSVWICSL